MLYVLNFLPNLLPTTHNEDGDHIVGIFKYTLAPRIMWEWVIHYVQMD